MTIRRRLFSLLCAAAVLTGLAGCACTANMAEVLQQPEGSQIRTRYHLWYTDPGNVSALNIMEGKFLPAGTVVEPVEVRRGYYDMLGKVSLVDGAIAFRTQAGEKFTIRYDARLHMMPIEDFIRQFFTTDGADTIYKAVPKGDMANVKQGKLTPGMHLESVLVVLGPPAKSRTTLLTNQSWLYWRTQDVVFRLIFKGDKIRQIASLEPLDTVRK